MKYGGKKNIPPELIFGKISGSLERMRENLKQALRHMPPDLTEEEKREFMDLLRTAGELGEEFDRAKQDQSHKIV